MRSNIEKLVLRRRTEKKLKKLFLWVRAPLDPISTTDKQIRYRGTPWQTIKFFEGLVSSATTCGVFKFPTHFRYKKISDQNKSKKMRIVWGSADDAKRRQWGKLASIQNPKKNSEHMQTCSPGDKNECAIRSIGNSSLSTHFFPISKQSNAKFCSTRGMFSQRKLSKPDECNATKVVKVGKPTQGELEPHRIK